MKILPDYLIEMMPALEEALEELRLSVIDHAYELLKCLDVDELSSDIIRRKLELYDLKIDNMTEEWLPNGKFYRMYPAIKHNRTRLNSLKSVVCSGGQFEGLWSNEFIKEAEHNYNKIRTLRHYFVQSEYDGYFYVSGNVNRTYVNGQDLVLDSTLTALSTDILLGQAMPAGYTYLYIPWPRPLYPSDSGYFYNVNMLNADRLHYALDCDTTDSYDESKPASLNYDWENGTNTPWRTPYWFDYHFMNNMTHTDPIEPQLETGDRYAGTWPIHEKGEYGNYNEDGDWESCNPEDAHFYKLDSSCSELSNSNAIFPTKCYIRSSNRSSHPNAEQIFTPKVLEDNEKIFTIDETNLDSITKENIHENDIDLFGTYRWDHLFDKGFQIIQEMSHIKTYKPIWSESSPIFAMMQSNFNSGLHPEEIAEHSFYNWFELKQQENIILPEESTIRYNDPPISEITHTSYDRPTSAHIPSNNVIVYTRAANDSQGDNKLLSSDTSSNGLYNLGENTIAEYDPINQYILTSLFSIENDDILEIKDSSKYIEGDPDTNKLYLNKNSVDNIGYCYASFITSSVHTLWFSSDKKNTDIGSVFALYNNVGANELYLYSNPVGLNYNVLGVYNENGIQLDSSDVSIELTVENNNGNYAYLLLGRINSVIELYASFNYDLNNQWKLAEDQEDESFVENAGNDYYVFKSYSNLHTADRSAEMFIDVTIDDSEDFNYVLKIVNSSTNLDYVTVTVDDKSYPFMMVYQWQDLELTLSNGQHHITVSFDKESSGYSGNDCGYIAIPKNCIDLNEMSANLSKSVVHHKNAASIKFTVSKSGAQPIIINPVSIDVLDPFGERIEAQFVENLGIIDVGFGYISISEFFELGYSFAPLIPVGIQYGTVSADHLRLTGVIEQGFTGKAVNINKSNLVNADLCERGIILGTQKLYVTFGDSYITAPANMIGIKSNYYWIYGFTSGNNLGNLYTPNYYESDLQLTSSNPTPESNGYTPSLEFSEVYIWYNGSAIDMSVSGEYTRVGMYPNQNGKPEFYTSYNISVSDSQRNEIVFICKPGSNPTWTSKSVFDLPNNIYRLNPSNNIIWDTSHPLYNILYGKTVIIYYNP